jgi:hypothetical protein
MRNTNFPPSVLAAILSACATESVNLNSERIEKRFGNYGIDVLASEAGLRRSSLFSYDGDTAICRTYAVVEFAEQLDERYNEAHSRVLAGDSIGATFREDGWGIRKKTLYIGSIRLQDESSELARLMHLSGEHDLALHIYQLVLVREDLELGYATIMEAHHPDCLAVTDLPGIFEYDTESPVSEEDLAHISDLLVRSENRN